jgi:hypothetical protein
MGTALRADKQAPFNLFAEEDLLTACTLEPDRLSLFLYLLPFARSHTFFFVLPTTMVWGFPFLTASLEVEPILLTQAVRGVLPGDSYYESPF